MWIYLIATRLEITGENSSSRQIYDRDFKKYLLQQIVLLACFLSFSNKLLLEEDHVKLRAPYKDKKLGKLSYIVALISSRSPTKVYLGF